MKTLKKIKLNGLNEAELKDREMNGLYGGTACGCGCNYAGSGGSSIQSNGNANFGIGSGGYSPGGCQGDSGSAYLYKTIVVS